MDIVELGEDVVPEQEVGPLPLGCQIPSDGPPEELDERWDPAGGGGGRDIGCWLDA